MVESFTAYEKGLEAKEELEKDKKVATTKSPAERPQAPQPNVPGYVKVGQDSGITYWKHESIPKKQLDPDLATAMSYLKNAPTGSQLLRQIKARSESKQEQLRVAVHFFAEIDDYPWKNAVDPNEKGHAKLASSIIPPILFWVSVFVARRTTTTSMIDVGGGHKILGPAKSPLEVDKPECIADTLFHELLHVWFIAKAGYNEILGWGHEAGASINIDSSCNKTYTGFEPDFQKQLQQFDKELGGIPGARKCCS